MAEFDRKSITLKLCIKKSETICFFVLTLQSQSCIIQE